jgi:hypothetical protein
VASGQRAVISKTHGHQEIERVEQAFQACAKPASLNWASAPEVPALRRYTNVADRLLIVDQTKS